MVKECFDVPRPSILAHIDFHMSLCDEGHMYSLHVVKCPTTCPAYADALFGLVAQFLKESKEDLQTGHDVVRLLQTMLGPLFEQKGEDFRVVYIHEVRDVEALLPPNHRMEGAYSTVAGVEAPHSFFFVPRAGARIRNPSVDPRRPTHCAI